MSQQLQITGGAKVRSLEGVITGSTGVLGSLPINGSNGIPQLDVNGKILVSQLPNSVMEYLGTWNAATNTPTLANGTGNAGDVYLCNVAGTVDFGAGPITFYVGDQVIYSGTIWQRASGATGSVTSVAVTETGDALTITGSPITTSGTINIGFAGTSAQYVAGDGTLVTFPTITTEAQRLITEVYNETGATLTKGTVVYINGGHGNLPTIAKALATGDATSAQTYGVVQTDIGNNTNGFVVVIGSLGDLDTQAYANGTQLYLSSTTAGAWTSTKQYAPAHLVYVGIVTRSHPTQGVVEIKIQNGYELDELHNVSAQTPSNNDGIFYNTSTSLWESKSIATALGYTPANAADLSNYVTLATSQVITGAKIFDGGVAFSSIGGLLGIEGGASVYKGLALAKGYPPSTFITGFSTLYSESGNNNAVFNDNSNTSKLQFQATSSYTYTFPANTGTVALTSDIPSVTNFVTLNTLQTIIATKIYTSLQYYNNGVYLQEGTSGSSTGYTSLAGNSNGIKINLGTGLSNNNLNFASTTTGNTYTFPNATGTVALTSDISGYVPTSRTLTINGTTYDLSADRSWTVSGSQWTTSGSDIYYNTGNVSIGSSSPTFAAGTGLYVYSATRSNLTLTNGTSNLIIFQDGADGYLNMQSTGNFVFRNTASNTERLRITNAGNVGIGYSSPSAKLTIVKGSHSSTLGASSVLQLSDTSFSGEAVGDRVEINFYTNSDSLPGNLQHATIGIVKTSTVDNEKADLYFATSTTGGSPVERMRIVSGGSVGIGTSDPFGQNSSLLALKGSGTTYNFFSIQDTVNQSGVSYIQFLNSTGGGTGNITRIGTTNAVSYNTTSDYRFKEDLREINGLEKIMAIKVYDFKWKDNEYRMDGVLAHELQEIIPFAVNGEKDEVDINGNIKGQGVDYSKIVPALVKAIQELKLEIDELKNK